MICDSQRWNRPRQPISETIAWQVGGNLSSLSSNVTVCFCTLAIHAPYRRRARLLCSDATTAPWIVLTDEPDDFADLPVRAIRHAPPPPIPVDSLARLPPPREGRRPPPYPATP